MQAQICQLTVDKEELVALLETELCYDLVKRFHAL